MLLFLLTSGLATAREFRFKNIDTKTDASFRGLSVIDNNVAWVSGTKGYVGKSINGGKNWTFRQVKGYEQCDFRSIYAFNSKTAIIANAGTPAFILRTEDGGQSWDAVYKKTDSAAFIDGIDFWNKKEGVIYGDPIHAHMLLLRTSDGGHTWKALSDKSRPVLADGEASFAASGTCIKCIKKKKVVIATGGKVSRLLVSNDRCKSWHSYSTPILQGESTTGIFSYLSAEKHKCFIAGGDYKNDTLRKDNIFYSEDNGNHWLYPNTPTRGYRECIVNMGDNTFLATGPGGTDISTNGGLDWKPFSDEPSFHVVKKSRKGNLIIIAGGKGKLSIVEEL